MTAHPASERITKILERHPRLVTALREGEYWPLEDGGVAFNIRVQSDDTEAIEGFEALAEYLDLPLEHVGAEEEPSRPLPPGPSMTLEEHVGRPARTSRQSGPIWSGLTYPPETSKGRGWKPSP